MEKTIVYGPINRRRALRVGGTVAGAFVTAGLTRPRAATAAAGATSTVLRGVTIVDTRDGSLQPDMTILIAGGKIVQVTPAASAPADPDARSVDARGKFVVPGYLDLHAHPLGSSDPQGSLTMMLAHGITGFREMGAWNTMLAQRRAGTLLPPVDGAPEVLEIGSAILTPANAATPAMALAEIDRQLAQGADFIKIIDYSPAVFFAVAAECKRRNVRFLGHLSPTIDVRQAAQSGMRSIEHMGPRDSVLLGCSTDEAALRPPAVAMAPKPSAGGAGMPAAPAGPVPASVITRAVANPTLATTPAEIARYQRVIDTFDATRSRDLAAHFVAAGTWHVPTLIRVRTMAVGDDPRYRNDPDLQYVPAQTRSTWEDVSDQFSAKFSAAERATLHALYDCSAQLVKPFKDAGVNMMAGSDLGGGFVVPGAGLHHEFDLLAAAGLTPLDVLQMTTLNGAKFLGREAAMGSVAVGKDANLVVLDANPVAAVANLHGIAGVVRAGVYFDSAALAALKKTTAARVANGVASTGTPRPPCC